MTTPTVRTRYAPSPTGMMHVGNLRTALYEYLIARSLGGSFILRIEDTDQERQVEGALDLIYQTLREVGMTHDEGPDVGGPHGPYVQSERLHLYRPHAEQLVAEGKAYHCFCSKERLESVRAAAEAAGNFAGGYDRHCRDLPAEVVKANLAAGMPSVIRQKMPLSGTTTFQDAVYGDISVENSELEDQVLLKSDGYPTYNFANVIDDHDMTISHVVRGSEYLSSTPKYNLLYEAFGWEIPTYVHLPLILNENGQKLSKRLGDKSFEDLLEEGYLVEAVINFIALLGWNPGGEEEIFSREELIQLFDENRLSKSPAAFDQKKMDWMSNDYLKNADFERVFELCRPFLEAAGRLTDKAEKLVELYKPQLKSADEIVPLTDLFFADFPALTEAEKEVMAAETVPTVLQAFKAKLEALTDEEFVTENIFPQIKAVQKETGIKGKNLFMPIRIAVSGEMHGPELPDTIYLLGREKSIQHLENMLETIQ